MAQADRAGVGGHGRFHVAQEGLVVAVGFDGDEFQTEPIAEREPGQVAAGVLGGGEDHAVTGLQLERGGDERDGFRDCADERDLVRLGAEQRGDLGAKGA